MWHCACMGYFAVASDGDGEGGSECVVSGSGWEGWEWAVVSHRMMPAANK